MRKLLLVFFIFLTLTIDLKAQWEIGAIVSPSASSFHSDPDIIGNQYTFPVSYGLRVQYPYNRLVFSSGILNLNQGNKTEWAMTTVDNPDGTGEYFDVITRIRAIVVPLNVDYNFLDGSTSKLFGGVGIYTGYIYQQQQENTSIPEGSSGTPGLMSRYTDVRWFDEFYLAMNAGLGWKQDLSDKFSLQLRPNFLFQISKDRPDFTSGITDRIITFSLDLGLIYKLQ